MLSGQHQVYRYIAARFVEKKTISHLHEMSNSPGVISKKNLICRLHEMSGAIGKQYTHIVCKQKHDVRLDGPGAGKPCQYKREKRQHLHGDDHMHRNADEISMSNLIAVVVKLLIIGAHAQ